MALDEKQIDDLIKEYQDNLKALDDIRQERNDAMAQMTDDELTHYLTQEYEDTYRSAKALGIPILYFGSCDPKLSKKLNKHHKHHFRT